MTDDVFLQGTPSLDEQFLSRWEMESPLPAPQLPGKPLGLSITLREAASGPRGQAGPQRRGPGLQLV